MVYLELITGRIVEVSDDQGNRLMTGTSFDNASSMKIEDDQGNIVTRIRRQYIIAVYKEKPQQACEDQVQTIEAEDTIKRGPGRPPKVSD